MPGIKVVEINSRRELDDFIRLPYAIYRDCPQYVPDLERDIPSCWPTTGTGSKAKRHPLPPMNMSKTMIDANYIYGVLNGRRMTLGELSSLTRLDTLCLTKALSCLRQENELCEYTEDGNGYIELRLGYQF